MRGFECPKIATDFRTNEEAHVAQSVEHILGKDEVTGSIPVVGSRLLFNNLKFIILRRVPSWLKKNFNELNRM